MNKKNYVSEKREVDVKTFLKGMLMGVCDTIPGISGGTIAFITGIYIRLINAIKSLTEIENVKLILNFQIKEFFRKIDIVFLIVLFLGVFFAIFSVANLVDFFLNNYLAYTLSFFVGLIIASSKIIYKEIGSHNLNNILVAIVTGLLGASFVFLSANPVNDPSMILIIIGGFVAASAMFLPGISGSFILLIFGLYDFIISSVKNPFNNLDVIALLGVSAVIGAILISRVVDFLYKKDKCKTLYGLLGLVIGSLLVPIYRIIQDITLNLSSVSSVILLALIGYVIVEIFQNIFKK